MFRDLTRAMRRLFKATRPVRIIVRNTAPAYADRGSYANTGVHIGPMCRCRWTSDGKYRVSVCTPCLIAAARS